MNYEPEDFEIFGVNWLVSFCLGGFFYSSQLLPERLPSGFIGFNLGSKQEVSLVFYLEAGERVYGGFEQYGEKVDFNIKYITLPADPLIYDAGTTYGGTSFDFMSDRNGDYAFNFHNNGNTTDAIYFHLDHETATLTVARNLGLLPLSVVGAAFVIVGFAGFFENKRSRLVDKAEQKSLLIMNRALLKDLSIALLVLGGLFLFGAAIAYFAGIKMIGLVGGSRTDYPMRPLSGPLLIAGIISPILGFWFLWRLKQEKSRYSEWKMVSASGFILGGISLAGPFVACFCSQLTGGPGFALHHVYPFRNPTLPLFLFGVVLVVIGFVTRQRSALSSFYGSSMPLHDDTVSTSVPQRAQMTPPKHTKNGISRKKIPGIVIVFIEGS